MLKYVKKIYGTDFIRYPQKLKMIVRAIKKDSNLDSKEKKIIMRIIKQKLKKDQKKYKKLIKKEEQKKAKNIFNMINKQFDLLKAVKVQKKIHDEIKTIQMKSLQKQLFDTMYNKLAGDLYRNKSLEIEKYMKKKSPRTLNWKGRLGGGSELEMQRAMLDNFNDNRALLVPDTTDNDSAIAEMLQTEMLHAGIPVEEEAVFDFPATTYTADDDAFFARQFAQQEVDALM